MPDAPSIRLDDTVAIVTGAARGLGRAMADGLARAGASVVYLDVDAVAVADATQSIAGTPGAGPALALACDIRWRENCERVVAETRKRFGAVHMLVNNAGRGPRPLEESPQTKSLKFWESDPAIWCDIIDTNVNGTFLMA